MNHSTFNKILYLLIFLPHLNTYYLLNFLKVNSQPHHNNHNILNVVNNTNSNKWVIEYNKL